MNETLSQLNSLLHRKNMEIQLQLSMCLKSIKILSVLGPNIISLMVNAKKSSPAFVNLHSTVRSFRALKMGSEISEVLISLLNLNREIKEFDYFEVKKEPLDIDEVPKLYKQRDNIATVLKNIDIVLSKANMGYPTDDKKSVQTEEYLSQYSIKENRPAYAQRQVARKVIEKIQNIHNEDIKQTQEDELKEER